jgi:hypothetical protein
MALLPVHVTLMNELDEVRAHQGEIGADAVRRLEVDAVIDTRYLAGPTDLRDDEASALLVPNLGTWEPMVGRR